MVKQSEVCFSAIPRHYDSSHPQHCNITNSFNYTTYPTQISGSGDDFKNNSGNYIRQTDGLTSDKWRHWNLIENVS